MGRTILIIVGLVLIASIAFSAIKLRQFRNMWFKEKPVYLDFKAEDEVFQFEWSGDSIGSHYEAHNAIIFRTKIKTVSNRFSFQFDTGAPITTIYGNVLQSLIDCGMEAKIVEIGEVRFLEELNLDLGGQPTTLRMLKITENYGAKVDFDTYKAGLYLGTIGSDIMVDKVTKIDFKNKSVEIRSERTEWMKTLPQFEKFDFEGRRFMFPCVIDNKKLKLFYDSGSSSFGLITTRNRFRRYAGGEETEIRLDANRRGSGIPIVHRATAEQLHIGGNQVPLTRISYVDMYAKFQGLITPFTRIGGWLGNMPFLNHVLIIDTKAEEFTVYKAMDHT